MDEAFFPLADLLELPGEDLPALYGFRNGGCLGAAALGSSSSPSPSPSVVLRLRPGLTKDQRRLVHRAVAGGCRDLETRTGSGGACISVGWSRRAQRMALQRKRRREADPAGNGNGNGDGGDGGTGGGRDRKRAAGAAAGTATAAVPLATGTLCVLRKRDTEHLSAIQGLCDTLRCRPGDVGLAGIKDRRAVTYQYVTLRDVPPGRARDANPLLRTMGMELGNFEGGGEWSSSLPLNPGDLAGNRFEVVVRDLGLIRLVRPSRNRNRNRSSSSSPGVLPRERTVPCPLLHLEAMVERVREGGFVNFYGEQRVGRAGRPSSVGVRPQDIGRSMLRGDYAGAIDLLMEGRRRTRRGGKDGDDEDGEDEDEDDGCRAAREAWREGRDPSRVLALMPRGGRGGRTRRARPAMERERAVLGGLRRYGTDEPLLALRCVPHGMRMLWVNAYQSHVWNRMATERLERYGPVPVAGDLCYCSAGEGEVGKEEVGKEDGGRGGLRRHRRRRREVRIVTDPASTDLGSIVLPLPGYGVRYPTNSIGELYRRTLEEDGVEFVRRTGTGTGTGSGSGSGSGSGTGTALPPERTARGSYRTLIARAGGLRLDVIGGSGGGDDGGRVRDARLSFDLPSGSYATMLLREVMVSTMARD